MKNVHVANESGVLGARNGKWHGFKSVFTHRNPKTGEVWGEDIPNNGDAAGRWVPYEKVEWLS